jgi:hypothetical protein
MKTFNGHEMKLIRKLKDLPPQTTLQILQPCLLHSYCNPLPVFRVYKIDDKMFEAQWNDVHSPGIKQVFSFEDVLETSFAEPHRE